MNQREEIIERIKDIGQSLIDNAEQIVGDYKYLNGLTITCYAYDLNEPAYYNVDHDIIAEKFIERMQ